MNIFMTHSDPIQSAREHCLVHVRKMILEYAQMLSTTHHHYESNLSNFVYKKAHYNHPSTKWTRESPYNYDWLFYCWSKLLFSYAEHYQKPHASSRLYDYLVKNPITNKQVEHYNFIKTTKLPCAMPNKYKVNEDSIVNYQVYLNAKFSEWKSRSRPIRVEFIYGAPDWYKESLA